MIKKIRVMLDYGCYPVWLYDGDGDLIDTLLPDELREDRELDHRFDDLQSRYEELFVNNSKEFSFVGFKTEEEKKKFISDWKKAVSDLESAVNGKYEIIDEFEKIIAE